MMRKKGSPLDLSIKVTNGLLRKERPALDTRAKHVSDPTSYRGVGNKEVCTARAVTKNNPLTWKMW